MCVGGVVGMKMLWWTMELPWWELFVELVTQHRAISPCRGSVSIFRPTGNRAGGSLANVVTHPISGEL